MALHSDQWACANCKEYADNSICKVHGHKPGLFGYCVNYREKGLEVEEDDVICEESRNDPKTELTVYNQDTIRLRALLEGLECREIDELIKFASADDLRSLGKAMTNTTKSIIKRWIKNEV